MNNQLNQPQMEIKASDEILKGKYANAMQISHNENEFFLDFMLIHPPVGQLIDRIIISPGHAKRISKALEENLKIFEKNFGRIEETEAPAEGIGFRDN
jgi:hypothetical protein